MFWTGNDTCLHAVNELVGGTKSHNEIPESFVTFNSHYCQLLRVALLIGSWKVSLFLHFLAGLSTSSETDISRGANPVRKWCSWAVHQSLTIWRDRCILGFIPESIWFSIHFRVKYLLDRWKSIIIFVISESHSIRSYKLSIKICEKCKTNVSVHSSVAGSMLSSVVWTQKSLYPYVKPMPLRNPVKIGGKMVRRGTYLEPL